jgi:hypothetical protein
MADEARDPAVVEYLRRSASRAGKARLTSMTAEQRKRVAKLAAEARWRKKTTSPEPTDPKGPDSDARPIRTGIMLNGPRRPLICRKPSTSARPQPLKRAAVAA